MWLLRINSGDHSLAIATGLHRSLHHPSTDDVQELAAVGKRLRAAVVAQPFPWIWKPTSGPPTSNCGVIRLGIGSRWRCMGQSFPGTVPILLG